MESSRTTVMSDGITNLRQRVLSPSEPRTGEEKLPTRRRRRGRRLYPHGGMRPSAAREAPTTVSHNRRGELPMGIPGRPIGDDGFNPV